MTGFPSGHLLYAFHIHAYRPWSNFAPYRSELPPAILKRSSPVLFLTWCRSGHRNHRALERYSWRIVSQVAVLVLQIRTSFHPDPGQQRL